MKQILRARLQILACGLIFLFGRPAEARLTRITAEPAIEVHFPSFGSTGAYLKIAGTFEGELDPSDRRNGVIADIEFAPRVNGKVRYKSTFFILRPADLSKGNGKLFYNFNNRGNKHILTWLNDAKRTNNPTAAEDFGNGFLMRYGYIVAFSGWAGDVTPGPDIMSIEVPTARNADGSSITGQAIAELITGQSDQTTISLPYASSSTSPENGVLTVRQNQGDPRVPVGGWTWAGERKIRFPGPAKIRWIYEFAYEAKDPEVMGIGHAATRDFLSFLRHGTSDDFGNPNPVTIEGGIQAVYSWGRSNGGRVQRDFVQWGFNEDEDGRMVFDGMMGYGMGSGGHVWMNYRFSQITVSAGQHRRHHSHEPEFPHAFPVTTDPLTGQTDGILRRCLATNTCPKFFNFDGANEYWEKTSSLNHTDAMGRDMDLGKLAPNVRLYAIAGIEHNTEFDEPPELLRRCQQMTNPLYNGPVFRAFAVALDRWVTQGTAPPPSRIPRQRDGELVPPEQVRFPKIPATHYAGWPALSAVEFHPGSANHNAPMDFSEQPYKHIPGQEYTVQVMQVDSDGNEIAGLRLPYLAAPLGTHTGWNWYPAGAGSPNRCGQEGSFIPFANTKAERMAAGDPRPSIEERYPGKQDYMNQVKAAARKLVEEGYLLEEDGARIVQRAERSGFRLWLEAP